MQLCATVFGFRLSTRLVDGSKGLTTARASAKTRTHLEETVPPPAFPVPAITRVILKNFKSIEGCDVKLAPMTMLVGPNGSGKSNFIDGLRLTSDAMNSTLENAIRERGGINDVRRRSRGHPTHFGVRIDVDLGSNANGFYAYQIAARKNQTLEVQREECRVLSHETSAAYFTVESGKVRWSLSEIRPPSVKANALALPLLSGEPAFSQIFQLLSNIGYYSLNLDRVRELQSTDPGNLLNRDGSNLASVIRNTAEHSPDTLKRITEYLAAVVPGIQAIQARALGPMETIEFRQDVLGDKNPWRYLASSVSDGTLRALGVLTAAFQLGSSASGIPLVAIEEPEIAIHPGAALRLMDALIEASRRRQLLLTTHSPDLLDHPQLDVDSVIAVQAERGTSRLGPVEATTKEAVRENLYTVGELLRLEQVRPDDIFALRQWPQLKLFE